VAQCNVSSWARFSSFNLLCMLESSHHSQSIYCSRIPCLNNQLRSI